MTTIKAYTDLEQSKKLAGILPLESADMFWYRDAVTKEGKPRIMNYMQIPKLQSMYYSPCWSLAALLDILPTIDDRNAVFCKDIRCDKWHVFYHGTATLPLIDTERHPDIIDACMAMIEKLHEYKML